MIEGAVAGTVEIPFPLLSHGDDPQRELLPRRLGVIH
jgi:hypothetical protein